MSKISMRIEVTGGSYIVEEWVGGMIVGSLYLTEPIAVAKLLCQKHKLYMEGKTWSTLLGG